MNTGYYRHSIRSRCSPVISLVLRRNRHQTDTMDRHQRMPLRPFQASARIHFASALPTPRPMISYESSLGIRGISGAVPAQFGRQLLRNGETILCDSATAMSLASFCGSSGKVIVIPSFFFLSDTVYKVPQKLSILQTRHQVDGFEGMSRHEKCANQR